MTFCQNTKTLSRSLKHKDSLCGVLANFFFYRSSINISPFGSANVLRAEQSVRKCPETIQIRVGTSVQESRDPHSLTHACLLGSCNPKNDFYKLKCSFLKMLHLTLRITHHCRTKIPFIMFKESEHHHSALHRITLTLICQYYSSQSTQKPKMFSKKRDMLRFSW